jgi:2-keto-3-deoxy-6-phosphogluconate aldolase
VIPVLTIERLADAVPLARALVKGGLPVLEITFRTGVAVEALAAIAREVPDAIVGAGTVLDEPQLRQAIDAGARFRGQPGRHRGAGQGGAGVQAAVPAGRADRVGSAGGAGAGLLPAEVLPGRCRGRTGLA